MVVSIACTETSGNLATCDGSLGVGSACWQATKSRNIMKQATIHTLFTGSTLYSLEFSSTVTTKFLATNQGNDTKDPLPGRLPGKILAYPVK